jgi:hypothetical protein
VGETTIGPLVCNDCDTVLVAAVVPNSTHLGACPNCGSSAQKLLISASDQAKGYEDADLRARATGSTRVLRHVKSGADQFRLTGEWRNRHRDIDFERDHYTEVITNEAGEKLRWVDQALSEHQGRGHAKRKPQP